MLSITLLLLLLLHQTILAQDYNNSSSNSNSSTDATLNSTKISSSNQTYPNNPGTNFRIPTTISATCQQFLAELNSNANLTSCTAPLLNATHSFSSGPKSVTREQVLKAFDGLCGSNSGSGCAPHIMYTILNQFSATCTSELQAGVEAVRMIYDVLYILTPYRVALCSKEPTTGDYCPSVIASSIVNGTASPSGSKSNNMTTADFSAMVNSVFGSKLVTQMGPSSPSTDHTVLHSRQLSNSTSNGSNFNTTTSSSSSQNLYNPNPDTYTNVNLAFLFLSPNLPDSALCKPCTQSVMAAYIGFEQATPHFGGLYSSSYLSGQLKLWKSISSRCGQKFIESINNEAGIMSILTSTSGANSSFFHLIFTFQSVSIISLLLISSKLFDLF